MSWRSGRRLRRRHLHWDASRDERRIVDVRDASHVFTVAASCNASQAKIHSPRLEATCTSHSPVRATKSANNGLQKLRQSWNKYNLYNFTRVSTPPAGNKTFFQQKWLAKNMLRSYHSPHVREGQWTRMFDRRLPSVVPMDYRELARSDGSEQSYGRGAGVMEMKDDPALLAGKVARRNPKTPYMHMTFHPLERRLDTAVWRALFASSTNQARQFVVRGGVKVNGKKMVYPGYLLNPGDMFTVEPDLVMFATGAPKAKDPDRDQEKSASRREKRSRKLRRPKGRRGRRRFRRKRMRQALQH